MNVIFDDKIEVVNTKIEGVNEDIKIVNAKIEGVNEEIKIVNAKIEGVNDKIEGVRGKIEGINGEIKDLHKTLFTLKKDEEVAKLNKLITLLEDQRSDLKGDLMSLEQQRASFDVQRGSLEHWRGSLEHQRASLEVDLKHHRVFLAEYKAAFAKPKIVKFGNAKREDIRRITGVVKLENQWGISDYVDNEVCPSSMFVPFLRQKFNVWSMGSEASLRTVIDVFLQDVVAQSCFQNRLRIFCEVKMDTGIVVVEGERQKLSGIHDYTIGNAGGRSIDEYTPPDDSHLVAVEAKRPWVDDDIWQCVAKAAALHKMRKDAGKANCQVWGIFSNVSNWKFIHIDQESGLSFSKTYTLELPFLHQEKKFFRVYRCVYYIVQQCFHASPTTSPSKCDEWRSKRSRH